MNEDFWLVFFAFCVDLKVKDLISITYSDKRNIFYIKDFVIYLEGLAHMPLAASFLPVLYKGECMLELKFMHPLNRLYIHNKKHRF